MRLAYYLSLSSSMFFLGEYHGEAALQYFGTPRGRHCFRAELRTSLYEFAWSQFYALQVWLLCVWGEQRLSIVNRRSRIFVKCNEAKNRRLSWILASYYRFFAFNFYDTISNNINVNHIWCRTKRRFSHVATYVFVRSHWSREYSRHVTGGRTSREPLSIGSGPNYASELFKIGRAKDSGFSRALPILQEGSILLTV